ncbi:MAG TPA: type II secretion system protein GspJ [Geobacterales bacterium]|nr:type II secretion system protein GspJ [Geobacterales bacterium]
MPSTAPSRGFTLIELMLALALMALLAALVYGSFFTLMRGREAAIAGMDERRQLRVTMELLRHEIASAMYQRGSSRFGFVVEDRDLFGRPASTLSLVTLAPLPAGNEPASDLLAVAWRPVDRQGRMVLTRASRDAAVAGDPLFYPQMDAIEGFLVECYNGKWVRSWDTTLNSALPEAVRVTITVREGEQKIPYVAIVRPRIKP